MTSPQAPEHRAILSSESQVSRFDRWVEFLSAAVLALATDETADRYVLLAVVFASVLFFAGIAGKFQSKLIDLAMLVAFIVFFAIGLGIALTFPRSCVKTNSTIS